MKIKKSILAVNIAISVVSVFVTLLCVDIYNKSQVEKDWFLSIHRYMEYNDIPIIFNDGEEVTISGQICFQLLEDSIFVDRIKNNFSNIKDLENSLLLPTLCTVIYETGCLMSVHESLEKRGDLSRYILEQLNHGIYNKDQQSPLNYYGIDVISVGISNVEYSKEFKVLLEKKNYINQQENKN